MSLEVDAENVVVPTSDEAVDGINENDNDARVRKHIDTNYDSDNDDDDQLDHQARSMAIPSSSLDRPSAGDDNIYSGMDGVDRPSSGMSSRRDLEDRLDRILKKPTVRRNRRDEEDLEQMLDEQILRLKDEMNIAAQLDVDTLNKRIETGDNTLIAMQKVKLLPRVISVLSKANLADTILDNNLLQSVRIWLEPLPDGSLPSYEIQKNLFSMIKELPIKTEHLKESGLGRVIIFYTKSKRVEPALARLAERLIAEWTRPIIGASDNYRDKRIMQLDFDAESLRKKDALTLTKRNKSSSNHVSKKSSKRGTPQTLYEQAAARRNRAAAPAQTTTDYKFAPVSQLNAVGGNVRASGVGSTLNNNEMYKRLTSRLNKTSKKK